MSNTSIMTPERTGWRDEAWSKWHRSLGAGFSLTNIDDLWVESIPPNETPVAVFELKAGKDIFLNDSSVKAIRKAIIASLPFFGVTYWFEPVPKFKVVDLNRAASDYLEKNYKKLELVLDEQGMIEFEKRIRKI